MKKYKLWVSCFLKPQQWWTLLTWQWSRRRSLTPSTKRVSHRGSLLKGGAVQGVLYQRILNTKLTGRNWVGKGAQATGMTASLRILSSKADSNTWERFTRSELKLKSVHQESPRFRKRATEPLLKQKHHQKHLTWATEKNNGMFSQWSKALFSDESTFCISFGNQGPRVWRKRRETQNPCCFKSSVKFPKSVMICGAVTSAGVGPLCFIKSKVNAAVCHEILKHFMLPSADKLYGDADFLFQQDFNTCPHCQNQFQMVCWPWYYCA